MGFVSIALPAVGSSSSPEPSHVCVISSERGQAAGAGWLGAEHEPWHRAGTGPGSGRQGAGAAGVAAEDREPPVPHQPGRVHQRKGDCGAGTQGLPDPQVTSSRKQPTWGTGCPCRASIPSSQLFRQLTSGSRELYFLTFLTYWFVVLLCSTKMLVSL